MKKFVLLFLLTLSGLVQSQEKLTRILFVFDASNSMNQKWGDESRFNTAKRILAQSVDSLRDIPNLELGLRVYGHQSPVTASYQDCEDTKLEVPFSANNHSFILNKIRSLRAKGTTPIARSLEAAASDFTDSTSRNIIILITDGVEACDDEPCVIADKLRAKGIKISPFIIGLGMDMSYLNQFDCFGNYKSAESPMAFKNVLKQIVDKTLVNTTVQINLNTINGEPRETDVTLFLYKAGTTELKYSFTHTLNELNLPDTIILDPAIQYDLVVKTLPQQRKNNITLQRNTHNIIEVDAPQGFMKVNFDRPTSNNYIDVRVMQQGEHATLNTQKFDEIQQYIVGTYEVEILTLPRRYKTVEINQSSTTKIAVAAPGTIKMRSGKPVVGQIFERKDNNEFEWVCDLNERSTSQEFTLQPGKYQVVYREKHLTSTNYTVSKSFTIFSTKTIIINL
jgi:Ca-activated chloride channel family protein